MKNVDSYGIINDSNLTDTVDIQKLKVSGKFISKVIAKNLTMDIKAFNKFNPDFDNKMMQWGECELKLPKDKMDLFKNNKYIILNECITLLLTDNDMPTTTTVKEEKKQNTTSQHSRKKRP